METRQLQVTLNSESTIQRRAPDSAQSAPKLLTASLSQNACSIPLLLDRHVGPQLLKHADQNNHKVVVRLANPPRLHQSRVNTSFLAPLLDPTPSLSLLSTCRIAPRTRQAQLTRIFLSRNQPSPVAQSTAHGKGNRN